MSKKKTSKKVSLQDFLTEKTSKSWGEREEETKVEEPKKTEEPKKEETVAFPIGDHAKEQPKQQEYQQKYEDKPREQTQQKRTYEPVDESKIPTNPPFVAYVGNLSFKVIEDDIAQLFGFDGVNKKKNFNQKKNLNI